MTGESADEVSLVRKLAQRIWAPSIVRSVERVPEGVSTRVYRVRLSSEEFYVRVLPEEGASFAPEVRLHVLLRERGVSVPEVIYWEHQNEALERSVMVTSEIRGRHLGHSSHIADIRAALVAAGRDLAVINGIQVNGFGWIRRDRATAMRLEAEHATNRGFIYEHLDADLGQLRAHGFTNSEIEAIETVISRYESWIDTPHAHLAHGDFDATHVFQEGGRYTGIIDFGEIRGADPLYDLGHFRTHQCETLPMEVLPYLLEGYREVTPLPADTLKRVSLLSLLIAIRALGRFVQRRPGGAWRHIGNAAIRREIAALNGLEVQH